MILEQSENNKNNIKLCSFHKSLWLSNGGGGVGGREEILILLYFLSFFNIDVEKKNKQQLHQSPLAKPS